MAATATTPMHPNTGQTTTTAAHSPDSITAAAYGPPPTRQENAVPTSRSQPIIRIRVIGPVAETRRVLTYLAAHAMPALYGPDATGRHQTRAAYPAGHLRGYFTITRKEID
jgi:hypothetical protein